MADRCRCHYVSYCNRSRIGFLYVKNHAACGVGMGLGILVEADDLSFIIQVDGQFLTQDNFQDNKYL